MSNNVDLVRQAYFYTNLPNNQTISFNVNRFTLPNFLDNEKISKDIDLFVNSKENYFLNFEVTYYFSTHYNSGSYSDVFCYTFPIILNGEFFKGIDFGSKRQEFNRVIEGFGGVGFDNSISIRSAFTQDINNDRKSFIFQSDIRNFTGKSLYLLSIVYVYKGLSKVKI